jgi:hypothetical protein
MKKKSDAPSREEWKGLFDAAKVFWRMKPWTWMEDTELFGVQDPESGEIGYCCVLGAAGEIFGLAAYLGPEGLATYRKIASEEGAGFEEITFHQKGLTVFFGGREALDTKDLQVIKELGLKFRGRNAWPLFRSHLPGYVPWFLTAREARFMTILLQQSGNIAARMKEDPETLHEKGEDLVLVRVPGKGKDTEVWSDYRLRPEPWEEPKPASGPVDEVRLHRIRKRLKKGEYEWEIDSFYYPGAIAEEGRPYYPCLAIIVDRPTDIIVGSWLKAPWERYAGFQEQVMNQLENTTDLPRTIRVGREEVFELLKPIAGPLNMKLEKVKSLEGVAQVRTAISRYMPGIQS